MTAATTTATTAGKIAANATASPAGGRADTARTRGGDQARAATTGRRRGRGGGARAVSDEELIRLASRLQERDREIIGYLAEYQVLTTQQVAWAAFGSLRQAQKRLRSLEDLGVVTSIRPRADTGSLPAHWILGAVGAVLRSISTGEPLRDVTLARRRALTAVLGPKRAHLIGVNDHFTRLMADTSGNLTAWWPERQCAARWADVITPDGYGEWESDGRMVGWWLEHDRGTEPLPVVVDKAMAYSDLQYLSGPAAERIWLLISCPSPRREQNIRDALADIAIACATGCHDRDTSPAAAMWQPLDNSGRVRLIDLADTPTPEVAAPVPDWPEPQ